jgi:broad specificity phosphatase PhoE
VAFTHIFSSQLQRAYKTAGLIREAQLSNRTDIISVPDVVKLPALMERDFGSYEGIKWNNYALRQTMKKDPAFVPSESKDSMARRMDSFLDEHILPLLTSQAPQNHVVAVVSHGLALAALWGCLLARFPPKSISLSPDLLEHPDASSLDRLGSHWSNTGYLELHMQRAVAPPPPAVAAQSLETSKPMFDLTNTTDQNNKAEVQALTDTSTDSATASPPLLNSILGCATVVTVNGQKHLKGQKRTRGGIGSAKHDPSQKSIDSFIKRQKV